MNNLFKNYRLVIIIVCLISVTACVSSSNKPSAKANDVPPTRDAVTPLFTRTPSPTVINTPDIILTLVPDPSETPEPTLTPLPTVPSQERGSAYNEMMNGNGNCVLPCWWGFELGQSSIDEVRQFYETLDAYIDERGTGSRRKRLYALFVDNQIEGGSQVGHTFIIQDDIVTEIMVETGFDSNYQIVPLLQNLGTPSEIWMWTIPSKFDGILPAYFRLFFPEQGVFALTAANGTRIEDKVHVCFDQSGSSVLLLWDPSIWDPNNTKGIADRSNDSGSAFELEGFSIEKVSNWSVDDFYTVLTDPNHTECLETPANLWISP